MRSGAPIRSRWVRIRRRKSDGAAAYAAWNARVNVSCVSYPAAKAIAVTAVSAQASSSAARSSRRRRCSTRGVSPIVRRKTRWKCVGDIPATSASRARSIASSMPSAISSAARRTASSCEDTVSGFTPQVCPAWPRARLTDLAKLSNPPDRAQAGTRSGEEVAHGFGRSRRRVSDNSHTGWSDRLALVPRNRMTGGVDAGMTAGPPMPTQDDVLGYFDTLSNWGRWGDEDELGTLNHITDDVRLAAGRAVRHGARPTPRTRPRSTHRALRRCNACPPGCRASGTSSAAAGPAPVRRVFATAREAQGAA